MPRYEGRVAALAVIRHPRPLIAGTLVRRYKRFLSDVRLGDGRVVTAHCVNPGAMEGLVRPGARVWLSEPDAASKRKLRFTWELIELDGVVIGANTLVANRIVRALLETQPRGFAHDELRAEYPYGERSRVDFWLRQGRREHFVEVKNCHLVYPDGRGYFPDSRSERAVRHLGELVEVIRAGQRATVMFTVQRGDVRAVRPSDVHDPAFAEAARRAADAGVRFRAVRIVPSLKGYSVEANIPVELGRYATRRVERWRGDNAAWSGSQG